MKKKFYLILCLFCIYCNSKLQSGTTMINNENPFSLRCSQDSCFEVTDLKIRGKLESKIDSLYQHGKIQYSVIDSNIKSNGAHYFIRLYRSGYNQEKCDSLLSECQKNLPEIYKEAYVQSQKPPCAIEGCFGRAIFDTTFRLISIK